MNDSSLSNTAIDFDNLDPLDLIEDNEPEKPDPDVMLGLLSSDNLQEQIEGARAFCEISDSRAVPLLVERLNHNCPLIRVSAAYALGRNTDSSAVQPLILTLQNDWNGYVRKGVVWALGNSGDRTSFQPLLHALKHDIAAVRLWGRLVVSLILPN